MTLEALLRRARAGFQRWDATREVLLSESRSLTRDASRWIRDWHRDAAPLPRPLETRVRTIQRILRRAPEFRHAGFVQQALGEYAEARILDDPSARDPLLAQLSGDVLILGVADAIGELRRRTLDHLLADKLDAAQAAFTRMERLFALLEDAPAPEALVPVRTKRDQARGVLERTRGDLVNAKKTKGLEKKIDRLGDLLDEAEGRPKTRPAKKRDDELDLDSAWSKS